MMRVRVKDTSGEIVFEEDVYVFLSVMMEAAGYEVDRIEFSSAAQGWYPLRKPPVANPEASREAEARRHENH